MSQPRASYLAPVKDARMELAEISPAAIGVCELAALMGSSPARLNRMLAGGLANILGAVNTGTTRAPSWYIPRAAAMRYLAGELAGNVIDARELAEAVAVIVAERLAGKALVFEAKR